MSSAVAPSRRHFEAFVMRLVRQAEAFGMARERAAEHEKDMLATHPTYLLKSTGYLALSEFVIREELAALEDAASAKRQGLDEIGTERFLSAMRKARGVGR